MSRKSLQLFYLTTVVNAMKHFQERLEWYCRNSSKVVVLSAVVNSIKKIGIIYTANGVFPKFCLMLGC
jgi:hypothetical protein